ncbi:odorant-binding protein 2b [Macaca thibetana thibetana]|uniref:odorant-binding protein 2b n=1 Tax=Macaca thibetana thibetana TaxID=257877 RepID=UPI0021BC5E65|nr:odorant-binding protein 2b [Macaca thibetana thibetana]
MYVKAMVVDKDFPEDRKPRKVSPVKVTALGGGDLEATFTFMREDRCVQKKILMWKTEEPGKFSAYGGRKLIYVQELPGRDHFIFYCKDQHRGGLFHMGKLMGRNPDINMEALEEFKKFVQHKGLSEEDIFIPLQTARPPLGSLRCQLGPSPPASVPTRSSSPSPLTEDAQRPARSLEELRSLWSPKAAQQWLMWGLQILGRELWAWPLPYPMASLTSALPSTAAPSLHPESTLLPDTEPGLPGPTLQP